MIKLKITKKFMIIFLLTFLLGLSGCQFDFFDNNDDLDNSDINDANKNIVELIVQEQLNDAVREQQQIENADNFKQRAAKIKEETAAIEQQTKALKQNIVRKNGYLESDDWIITWCVGHLVTMSYPEKYDEKLKFWRLDTLPFLPEEYKYEIIPTVQNQFNIIKT